MGNYCIFKTKEFIDLQDTYNVSESELKSAIKAWCDANDKHWDDATDSDVKQYLDKVFNAFVVDISDNEQSDGLTKMYKELNGAVFNSVDAIDININDLKILFGDNSKFIIQKDGSVRISLPADRITDEEMQSILENAKRDENGNLLAPNGKPTNLTERQYAQVRTKSFKEWFGDWETFAKIKNANVIWGHPGTGKTWLFEQGRKDIIDFDSEYKSRLGNLKEREELKERMGKDAYNAELDKLFDEAKNEALSSGRKLLVSDMHFLRNRSNELDAITNISDNEFIKRSHQRGEHDEANKQEWKDSINKALLNVQQDKIINTTGYISELLDWAKAGKTVVQDDNSYYRGQYEEPFIDIEGNLILKGKHDTLYDRGGYNIDRGVSATTDMITADEYGYHQKYAYIADVEEKYGEMEFSWEADNEIMEIENNGYYLIQFPKNIFNDIVKEAGEVKIIGDVKVPKGEYVIEHITPDGTETIAFKRPNVSKVVDENDEPRVVYHWTTSKFDTFDESKNNPDNENWFGNGFYFAVNPMYSRSLGEEDGILMPCFLNLRNPMRRKFDYKDHNANVGVEQNNWRERGNDGNIVEITDKVPVYNESGEIVGYDDFSDFEIVVKNANDIKSAEGNVGYFDSRSANIYNRPDEESKRASRLSVGDIFGDRKSISVTDFMNAFRTGGEMDVFMQTLVNMANFGAVNKIVLDDTIKSAGEYDVKNRVIRVRSNTNLPIAQVITHELVHMVTVSKMMRNNDAVNELNKIIEHIKSTCTPEELKQYALTDPYEFIAEVISNREFVAFLQSKDAYNTNRPRGIISGMINWFRKLLKHTTDSVTLLDNVLYEVENILSTQEFNKLTYSDYINKISHEIYSAYISGNIEDFNNLLDKYKDFIDLSKAKGYGKKFTNIYKSLDEYNRDKLVRTTFDLRDNLNIQDGINAVNKIIEWSNKHTVRHPNFAENHKYGQVITKDEYDRINQENAELKRLGMSEESFKNRVFKVGKTYAKEIDSSASQAEIKNAVMPAGFDKVSTEKNFGNWALPSSIAGTEADSINRGFWMKVMGERFGNKKMVAEGDKLIKSVKNISKVDVNNLVSQLEDMRDELDKMNARNGGYYVCTEEFPMSAKLADGTTIAGTIDMMLVTGNGDIYIMDFKGNRNLTDSKVNEYNVQLLTYKAMIEANFPELKGTIKGLYIVPMEMQYNNFPVIHGQAPSTELKNGKVYIKGTNEQVTFTPRFIDRTGKKNSPTFMMKLNNKLKLRQELESLSPEELIELGLTEEEVKNDSNWYTDDFERDFANDGGNATMQQSKEQPQSAEVATRQQTQSSKESKPKFKSQIIKDTSELEGVKNTLQAQRINLMKCPFMTMREVYYLANEYARLVSSLIDDMYMSARNGDEIDVLNSIPLDRRESIKSQISKDISRDKLVQIVGINNIMDYARDNMFLTFNDEKEKNLDFCKSNWSAFVEQSYSKLIELEGITIKGEKEVDQEIGDIMSFENQEDGQLEHWQIGMRQVSSVKSLSKELKCIFGKINIESDGDLVDDEFGYGFPKTVDPTTMVAQTFAWCNRAGSVSKMIDILTEHSKEEGNEWASVVVDAINSDERLKSMFYNNFKKDGLSYSIAYDDEKKGPRIMIVNNLDYGRNAAEQVRADISMDNTSWLRADTESIEGVREAIKELKDRSKNIIDSVRKDGWDKNYSKIAQWLMDVYGVKVDAKTIKKIEKDKSKDAFYGSDHSELKQIFTSTKYFLDAASSIGVDDNYDDLLHEETIDGRKSKFNRYSDVKKVFDIIGKHIAVEQESSTYQDDKMYYTYQPPSYLHKMIVNLTGGTETTASGKKQFVRDYVEREFGYDRMFKFESTGRYRLGWLERLTRDNDNGMRDKFEHKVQLTYNGTKYSELSQVQYLKSLISEFFANDYSYERTERDENRHTAWYRVPILSNKPSSEFIRAPKFFGTTNEVKQQTANALVDVFYQEITRMLSVIERVNSNPNNEFEPIKNFDLDWSDKDVIKFKKAFDSKKGINRDMLRSIVSKKGGCKFFFLSKLNDYIANDNKVCDLIVDLINRKNTDDFNNEISNDEVIDMLVGENGIIMNMLDEIAEEDLDAYEDAGLFDTFKSGNRRYFKHLGSISKDLSGDYSEKKLSDAKSMLKEFIWNDFYAQTQIIQLTAGDLAFYKNTEDFQKRVAQIHAPAARLNKEAKWVSDSTDKNTILPDGRVSKDGKIRTMFIGDQKISSELIPFIKESFEYAIDNASSKEEKEYLKKTLEFCINEFSKVNVTDAQSFTSPTAYRKKMVCQGQWNDEMENAYQEIVKGNFDIYNLDVLFQPIKPFVFTNYKKTTGSKYRSEMRVPNQQKNSEYMLFLADAIGRGRSNSKNVISSLFRFMEDSAYDTIEDKDGKFVKVYNGRGIDSIQFESAVKVGLMGVIDINGLSYEDVERKLTDACYNTNDEYNDQFVHEVDMDDYGIQQPVPEHFIDHEQQMGSQIRILAIGDLLKSSRFNMKETFTMKNSGIVDSDNLRNTYETMISENIKDSMQLLVNELGLDGKSRLEKNAALSRLLQSEIIKDNKYGIDMLVACSLDENGEFYIPLQDPLQAARIEQLLNSIIKSRICKQKINGGPVVQSTNFGYDNTLKINIEKDESGRNRVKSFQCLITCPSAELERILTVETKDGNRLMSLDEALRKGVLDKASIEKIKKMISYRIPTEGKYSMMNVEVVGFAPRMGGETIVLPQEITTLTGSDFDVDKMYVERFSGKFVKRGKGKYSYVIDGENDGDFNSDDIETRINARNNALLEMQYAVLSNPDYITEIMNPGNFESLKGYAKSINELTKDSGSNRNICQVSSQIYFHKQNMIAAKLIGVFANANTAHAFLGMHETIYNGESFSFCGHEISNGEKFDKRLAFDGEPVAKKLASLLAASVDAVKDPVLNYLGINMTTVNIATFLTRCGYSGYEIALLLNQPIVKSVVSMVESSSGGDYELSLKSAIRAKYKEIIENDSNYANTNDKTFGAYVSSNFGVVSKNNFNVETLEENIENESAHRNDLDMLVFLDFLNSVSRSVDDVTFLTKFNSMSNAVGPRIANNISIASRAEKIIGDMRFGKSALIVKNDKGSSVAITDVDKIAGTFYDVMYGDDGLWHKVFDDNFTYSRSDFAKDLYELIPYANPTPEDMSEFVNDWVLFNMASGDRFIRNNPEEYVDGTFFDEFTDWKLDNPDSEIAKRLRISVSRVGNTEVKTIDLVSDTNTNLESNDRFRQEWAELLESDNQDDVNMAISLFEYSIIRGGMGFLPRNYGFLVPLQVKRAHDGYMQTISDIPTLDTLDSNTMVDLFISNHTYDERLFPKKSKTWFKKYQNNANKHTPRVRVGDDFYVITSMGDSSVYIKIEPRGCKFKYKDYFGFKIMDAVYDKSSSEVDEATEDIFSDASVMLGEPAGKLDDKLKKPSPKAKKQIDNSEKRVCRK